MKNFFALAIGLMLFLSGCESMRSQAYFDNKQSAINIDKAIEAHGVVANKIQIGDSKEKVLAILLPTQETMKKKSTKLADKYLQNGIQVEIYYMRSARVDDSLLTDNEFTPYVFKNDILTAIGWNTLGGPKTVGKAKGKKQEQTKQGLGLLCKKAIAKGSRTGIAVHCD